MPVETKTVQEIQEVMTNVKVGFERANVLKSFLSYSDSEGKGVLEYDSSSRSFYHLHTTNHKAYEIQDVEVYFILKNIQEGKYKQTNLMQVIKN